MSGVLIVESRPNSAEELETYHAWYDQVHIPELLALDGFVSARRFSAPDGESFIAVYEIEGDIDAAQASLRDGHATGRMTPPQGVQLDPPPVARFVRQIGTFSS